MTEGYIYILFNRAYQSDYYKIGMTTKTPQERALDISGATGYHAHSRCFMNKESQTAA
jgi:hypothetical protein